MLKVKQENEKNLETVYDLDGYFLSCEQIEQGINTKETIWFVNAVRPILEEKLSNAPELNSRLGSNTGKSILRRVFMDLYPEFARAFMGRSES